MNFRQWVGHADKGTIKRLTWCYGTQVALREDLVQRLHTSITPPEFPVVREVVDLSRQPVSDLVDVIRQFPLRPGTVRLVVARHAERLTAQDRPALLDWLLQARSQPGTYLVVVSESDTAPTLELRAGLGTRGHLVQCVRPNLRDLTWWVQRLAPHLGADITELLALRLGGNLLRLRDLCQVLTLLEVNPTVRQVQALCPLTPAETFVELVLSLRRQDALAAAEAVTPQEYRAVVGLLASRLVMMEWLHHAVRTEMSRREIAEMDGVPYFLATQFLPVAQHYSRSRCARCRTALAVLDAAVAGGARDGVLAVLITQWM